jgi:hypothetical protein
MPSPIPARQGVPNSNLSIPCNCAYFYSSSLSRCCLALAIASSCPCLRPCCRKVRRPERWRMQKRRLIRPRPAARALRISLTRIRCPGIHSSLCWGNQPRRGDQRRAQLFPEFRAADGRQAAVQDRAEIRTGGTLGNELQLPVRTQRRAAGRRISADRFDGCETVRIHGLEQQRQRRVR